MKLTPALRDELLIRLDERSRNTYHLVEKLERHNAEQNGYIMEQGKQTASNKTSINRLWWLLGIAVIGGGSAIGLVNWLV